jgi:hypothetical protein
MPNHSTPKPRPQDGCAAGAVREQDRNVNPIYAGRTLVGHTQWFPSRRRARAFDHDGRLLGTFTSTCAASDAVVAAGLDCGALRWTSANMQRQWEASAKKRRKMTHGDKTATRGGSRERPRPLAARARTR